MSFCSAKASIYTLQRKIDVLNRYAQILSNLVDRSRQAVDLTALAIGLAIAKLRDSVNRSGSGLLGVGSLPILTLAKRVSLKTFDL